MLLQHRNVADDNAPRAHDFSENKDIKYLISELLKEPNQEKRVHIYKDYLAACRFNSQYSPNGVITFSQADASEIGRWAALRTQGDPNSTQLPQVDYFAQFL